MARFEKSRPKGTKPHAAVAPARRRAQTAPSIEDTMFFPRLRRHAKWVFVFLALVFGLGFVGFGVGAGGVGFGDILKGSGGSGSSIDKASKATEEHPKDPKAWSDLSNALATDGQTEEAIAPLDRAIQLAPKDDDLYRTLAGLHLALANEKQREAQIAQAVSVYRAPAQVFPSLFAKSGQTVFQDPITLGVSAITSGRINIALQAASTHATLAVDAYKRLVALQPDDPTTQLELANAAKQTGDTVTAIGAYEQFLELAPDDPNAGVVRAQLKQLRGTSG